MASERVLRLPEVAAEQLLIGGMFTSLGDKPSQQYPSLMVLYSVADVLCTDSQFVFTVTL